MGTQNAATIKFPIMRKGILLPNPSLNLPHKTCKTLFDMFLEELNHPISAEDAPRCTAYALMKGRIIPKPKALTTEY